MLSNLDSSGSESDLSGHTSPSIRILFVCLGNICRSPMAEGVMRHLVADAGLADVIEVDSAGTGGWHVGEPPDHRAIAAARQHGVELGGVVRVVTTEDFDEFDFILPVDEPNFRDLGQWQRQESTAALTKFAEYTGCDVPDPYFGGQDGFEEVYQIVERGCRALLEELREQIGELPGQIEELRGQIEE